MRTEQLTHQQNDEDVFTITPPDTDGEFSLIIHGNESDSTFYINKDEMLTIIKFLIRFI